MDVYYYYYYYFKETLHFLLLKSLESIIFSFLPPKIINPPRAFHNNFMILLKLNPLRIAKHIIDTVTHLMLRTYSESIIRGAHWAAKEAGKDVKLVLFMFCTPGIDNCWHFLLALFRREACWKRMQSYVRR